MKLYSYQKFAVTAYKTPRLLLTAYDVFERALLSHISQAQGLKYEDLLEFFAPSSKPAPSHDYLWADVCDQFDARMSMHFNGVKDVLGLKFSEYLDTYRRYDGPLLPHSTSLHIAINEVRVNGSALRVIKASQKCTNTRPS